MTVRLIKRAISSIGGGEDIMDTLWLCLYRSATMPFSSVIVVEGDDRAYPFVSYILLGLDSAHDNL